MKLYGTTLRLELTKVGTNRVQFVRRMGSATSSREFTGNFHDLAAALLRTRTSSAKTVREANIVLCELEGQPFIVQVDGGTTSMSPVGLGTRASRTN